MYPQCGSTGCLGLARFLSDCQSCLVFSGTPPSLARAPGEFGWCVQNESCLPVSGETQGGRKEAGRESLSRSRKKRCWELTWEGLDSCWTRFQKWAKVTSPHSPETGQTIVRSHTFGAVWSGHFIIFPKTALPKSHLVTMI